MGMIPSTDIGFQKQSGALSPRLRRGITNEAHVDFAVASALVVLILAYTVFAMVQSLISFSMNRVIGGALFLVLAFDFLRHLTGPKIVGACFVGLIAAVGIGVSTTSRSDEIEYWIYWGCTMLMLCYIARPGAIDDLVEACFRCKRLMAAAAIMVACLIAVLLVTRTGYYRSWGGSLYFSGLCNTAHTMGSVCCIVLAMTLLSSRIRAFSISVSYLVAAMALFALLQTGARTFLVPAFIVLLLLVKSTIPWKWLRVVVLAFVVAAVVAVFITSGMADKFTYVMQQDGNEQASAFSSGRIDYWAADLGAFFAGGPLNQLLGNSASFVYDLNQKVFLMRIWSHNDFVMTLCVTGWCGLFLYIAALKNFFVCLHKRLRSGHFFLLLVYVLFPAMINGFYGYQHLLYSTVILVCALVIGRDGLVCKTATKADTLGRESC